MTLEVIRSYNVGTAVLYNNIIKTIEGISSSEWRHNRYLGLLGYTSVAVMKGFMQNFPVKKPLRVLQSIAHILMETSYSIWIARCTQLAAQNAIDSSNTVT